MTNNVTTAINVGATLPNGTTIETEDQGGSVHRQIVKIGGVTSGTKIGISDTSGNGLDYTEPVLTQDYSAPTSDLTQATLSTASSGNNTVVAAVSGQTTRVHRMLISSAGTTVVSILRGSTTLAKLNLIAGSVVLLPFNSRPWFATAANETLVINNSLAIQIDVLTEYITSV
jgi:hypothetical protein